MDVAHPKPRLTALAESARPNDRPTLQCSRCVWPTEHRVVITEEERIDAAHELGRKLGDLRDYVLARCGVCGTPRTWGCR